MAPKQTAEPKVGLPPHTAATLRAHAAELLLLLRERPADRAAASALIGGEAPGQLLDALVAAGLIAEQGGALKFVSPGPTLAALTVSILSDEQRRLNELAELVADLPEFARAWQLGGDSGEAAGSETARDEIQGEVARDPDAAMQRWFELGARSGPMQACAIAPDLEWVRTELSPLLAAAPDFFRDEFSVQYLFLPSALENDEDRALIDQLVDLGAQVRLSPRLPGWVSLERDAMACVPITWGDSAPEGIVFIYSQPIVSAVQSLFDSLWATAAPYPHSGESWQSVLDLMGQGKNDEQIADALGIGLRTVRRRVAEAMESLGVSSRFELGAAWAGQTT